MVRDVIVLVLQSLAGRRIYLFMSRWCIIFYCHYLLMSMYSVYVQVVCLHLLSLPVDVHGRALPKRPKDLSRNIQSLAIRLIEEGVLRHYEVLSMDLISNGLTALSDMKAMFKDKRYFTIV